MNRKQILTILLLLVGIPVGAQVFRDSTGFRTDLADNVAELLRGSLPGVRVSNIDGNPVGAMNVHIRGINSLRSDNQPLWIVDGVMISGNLSDNRDAFWQYGEQSYTAPLNPLAFLNAEEVESIEVIKDASATAVYGVNGANGVVIIKTKLPSKGARRIGWKSRLMLNSGQGSTSLGQNHHIEIGGAANQTSYNISGNYRRIAGVLPENGSDYTSLRGRFETRANSVLQFGLSTILSVGRVHAPAGTAWLGSPSYTLALRRADLSPGITDQNWLTDYDDDSEDYRGLFSSFININFTKQLSLTVRGGLDFQDNKRVVWYGLGTDLGKISEDNPSGGAAAVLSSMLLAYNGSAELKFNHFFGTNHHVTALLNADVRGNSDKLNTMNAKNFPTHELRGKGINMGNSPRNNHLFYSSWFHLGSHLNLSYDWRGRAGINLTARWDTTPSFGNNVSAFYPAAELFFQLLPAIRLDAGYGRSGKEKYVPYERFGEYLSVQWPEPAFGTTAFHDGFDRLFTSEWHAGLHFELYGGRFSGGVRYYDRKTEDRFEMYRNGKAGEDGSWVWSKSKRVFDLSSTVANHGFETDFNAVLLKGRKVGLSISANISYNENKLISSNVSDFYGRVVGHEIYCSCNAVDLPVSSLYGYLSDVDGHYKDSTGEGWLSTSDKVILGNTIPKWYGGLTAVLSYHGFNFELGLDGAAGHKIANINTLVADSEPDPAGKIVLSSRFVEKGDFLRIGRLALSWHTPVKFSGLKEITLRLTCNNAGIISSYSGWNPDVNSFGINSLSNGFDYGSFPFVRNYIISVCAGF